MDRVFPEMGEESSSIVSTSATNIPYTCTARSGILLIVPSKRLDVVAIIRRLSIDFVNNNCRRLVPSYLSAR